MYHTTLAMSIVISGLACVPTEACLSVTFTWTSSEQRELIRTNRALLCNSVAIFGIRKILTKLIWLGARRVQY